MHLLLSTLRMFFKCFLPTWFVIRIWIWYRIAFPSYHTSSSACCYNIGNLEDSQDPQSSDTNGSNSCDKINILEPLDRDVLSHFMCLHKMLNPTISSGTWYRAEDEWQARHTIDCNVCKDCCCPWNQVRRSSLWIKARSIFALVAFLQGSDLQTPSSWWWQTRREVAHPLDWEPLHLKIMMFSLQLKLYCNEAWVNSILTRIWRSAASQSTPIVCPYLKSWAKTPALDGPRAFCTGSAQHQRNPLSHMVSQSWCLKRVRQGYYGAFGYARHEYRSFEREPLSLRIAHLHVRKLAQKRIYAQR